jgi:hypothetical protein
MLPTHSTQKQNSSRENAQNVWSDDYGMAVDAATEPLNAGSYRVELRMFQKDIRELTQELKGYRLPVTDSDRAQTLVGNIRERAGFLDSYLWSATRRTVSDIRISQDTGSLAENTTLVKRLSVLVRAVKFFQQHIPDWEGTELEKLLNYHLDRLRGPTPKSSAGPAR